MNGNVKTGVSMLAAVLAAGVALATDFNLDEMDLSTMYCGKWRPKVGKSYNGKPIVLGGVTYGHGVGVLPESAYDVVTGGKAIAFTAKVGINDDIDERGSVRFRVWTDGACAYDSGAISARPKGAKESARDVRVDLRGVRIVTLQVTRGVSGTHFNHGVWADAKFTFEDGARPLDPKSGTRQLGILTPPESAAPRINGPAVYGVRPGHPVVYRLPVTGERPLSLAVDGLDDARMKGLSFNPDSQVLGGVAPVEKGEYRLLFKAENAKGSSVREFRLIVGDRIALTPPMGWNSWNAYGSNVSGEHILKTARLMVEKGLADHGWSYVNIDDYWQNQPELKPWCKRKELGAKCRTDDGEVIPNVFFDMPRIVSALHGCGLKAGIYSSPGPTTCGGCEGSWRHEAQDAARYAAWGFDYLKYDWCSYKDVATGEGLERSVRPYRLMGAELLKQPRDIVFTLCQYGEKGVSEWGESVGGNCWRISDDIFDSWGSVLYALDSVRPAARNSKPGAWNDADALVIGAMRPRGPEPHAAILSPNERYTHVSLWALSSSPLMIGCRLDELDDFTRSLLVNDEVIAVDQDPLGKGGEPVQGDEWSEVWLKPMADGSYVAALFNRGLPERTVTFDLGKAGLAGSWRVRDLWRQRHEGVATGRYAASVPGHATHLVRLDRIGTHAVCLDKGWTFVRDGRKEVVDLPHDAAIGSDFDTKRYPARCGALPYWGKAEYIRQFTVSESEMTDGTDGWRLEFDGVMSYAQVVVNGRLAGERPNGYSSFVVPLRGLLVAGTNEVKVSVDARKDSSRWYPGLGIYRDVRLIRAPADHIVPGSVAISFPEVSTASATVKVEYEMSKGGRRTRTFQVRAPRLWSPEDPYLYVLDLEGESFRYGIRTLRFSPSEGFFLNGRHRQMKGVCLHHDLGLFGAAFDRNAARRQLSLLKEMGCDAIRTSHNFPSPKLLDLCDELGLMVMDEAYDEWQYGVTSDGSAKYWDVWHERDVVDFVRRDRNHPCVVMWSAGNELAEDSPDPERTKAGVRISRELTALFHAHDPQGRPVTAGHWQEHTITNGIGTGTDAYGANYMPHRYAEFRGRQGIVGTETCSTISSRGVYRFDVTNKFAIAGQVSSYDLCTMWPNDYPPDVEFAAQRDNPHVYGEFVWTGFDYLGEPDPWGKTSRSSYFGIFDLAGFPKDRYWLYRSVWRPDVPTAHILPHWNWKEGTVLPVHVYTSGDEAELFVNGVSQGRRMRGPNDFRLVWKDVIWQAGEVSVRTWKSGREWASDKIKTSGAFDHFEFTDEIIGDLLFRTARAVDSQGVFVPDAAEAVLYDLPTGYEFVGTCNGDATDMRSLRSTEVRSFSGLALIVFRADQKRLGKCPNCPW